VGVEKANRMKFSYLPDSEDLLLRLKDFASVSVPNLEVIETVSSILKDIREGGDKALLEKTLLYDHATLLPVEILVNQAELDDAEAKLNAAERTSIEEAIRNVQLFHEKTMPSDWSTINEHGAEVGEKHYPIKRVGIYVPGGNVPLVSTVIMTVTLAKVAGVPEIAVVTPPGADGKVAVQLLGALQILGVSEVYRVGGAQAIGALAYGTESIPAVDKIYGPGNAYVNEAKRQAFGAVGIDLLPGPSEVMVIADETANPAYVAAALLAQAEHGSGKEKIYLLFTEETLFPKVVEELETQVQTLSHRSAIEKVLECGFRSVFLSDLARVSEVATFIAPEHLELQVSEDNLTFLTKEISTAGAFLMGHCTATSLGDFVAGPSHVLPTGRSARFSSGLKLNDFFRRTSFIRYNEQSAKKALPAVSEFALMEQLDAHGRSLFIRVAKDD
jgi:histidinol dehydrogenase